ncbi:hypothetical protein [Lepagella muris]|uniref:Uncharacterized protein n=1 Tax=Lepagella muris TaxID=3032870 RepID=A0AC61RMF3_9BACT|nr:hypothetical protein [Lepagella muris]TGY80911.1 hypothetical protein E5331_00600 [Lepagella muris]THG53989.1 hypothetical protein E5984_00600 [Bacteroidales bacterium]TKC57419.1 hypothetical protein E5359_012190 [Bacteroidales bacterium]
MLNRLITMQRIAKAIFLVALLFIVAMIGLAISCKPATHAEWQELHDKECASHITKFNYEGHTYLLYNDGDIGVGIAHDANCDCFYIPNSDYD